LGEKDMKGMTLTELIKLAEQTNNINLLKMIKYEIEKKIETLLIEYGKSLVKKPKKKNPIGFIWNKD
jgi:hypothetical protein